MSGESSTPPENISEGYKTSDTPIRLFSELKAGKLYYLKSPLKSKDDVMEQFKQISTKLGKYFSFILGSEGDSFYTGGNISEKLAEKVVAGLYVYCIGDDDLSYQEDKVIPRKKFNYYSEDGTLAYNNTVRPNPMAYYSIPNAFLKPDEFLGPDVILQPLEIRPVTRTLGSRFTDAVKRLLPNKKPRGGKKSIKRKKTNSRLRRRFSIRRKKHN
jgi:hypothetical protein